MADRKTVIYGDQIADGTVTKDELDIANSSTDTYILSWDDATGKFKWIVAPAGSGSSILKSIIYQASEGQSDTTNASWQDKLNYTSPVLSAATYQIYIHAEIERAGIGALSKARLIVDGTEYVYHAEQADTNDWKTVNGIVQLTLTAATHNFIIQFASGTAGRTVSIRRARLIVIQIL